MWSKVASGLDWYLAQNPAECVGILALSYDDLPPHLKPCFLYFGVFPEDYEIPFRRLIRLWIAEGFVDEGSNTSLDMEMAEEYLLQLIDRSLIQVVNRSDGGVKSCRIHDLLRDLCISKGEEENFLVISKAVGSSLPFNKPIRRLVVDYRSSDMRMQQLVQLRYLRINGDFGGENVTTISNANLQTLDLQNFRWSPLRINVWRMQQLNHLILYSPNRRVYIEKGNRNSSLPNLRTLSGLRLREEDNLDMLENFPNLKKLKLWLSCGQVELLEYLRKLQSLQVMNITGSFKFTDSGALPLSLTKVTLVRTHLNTSAFTKLGGLPNLQVLKLLCDALRGSLLDYDSDQGRFPKLQVLHIRFLDIGLWSMKGQGLQSLVYLLTDNCRILEAIPDQLKQISTLRYFKVRDCPNLVLWVVFNSFG